MPIDKNQVTAAFQSLIETPFLVDCAQRLGRSFDVYGGVVRNLVLSLAAESRDNFGVYSSRSLFDLVDPLSDIDVAVENVLDWAQLSRLIRQTIALAGFFRWEPISRSSAQKSSARFENIPIDRMCIRILPGTDVENAIELHGTGVDIDNVLSEVSAGAISLDLRADDHEERRLDRVMILLKVARYMSQYTLIERGTWEAFYRKTLSAGLPPDTRFLSAIDRFRLESAVLDVLFSCRKLADVSDYLTKTLALLEPQQVNSKLIKEILRILPNVTNIERETDSHVGIVVYPGVQGSLPKFEPLLVDSTGNGSTQIPWTEVNAIGSLGDDSCCYRDFSLGAVTIVWRPLMPLEPEKIGRPHRSHKIQGRVRAEALGSIDESDENLWYPISLPAFSQAKLATVIRADHGYIRGIVGRNATFMLGLTGTD